MTLPLIEKYRAKKVSDIIGQDTAIQDVKIFLKTFPRKRAIILNGPVGSGKTSIALTITKEMGLELFELNASDLRNRSSLEMVLKPVTAQKSLFNKGKIILMDEADGITTNDRGGLPELVNLINKTKFPIIITSNNIWQKKFNLLRQKCSIINIKELKPTSLMTIAKKVLSEEKIDFDDEIIKKIINNSKGDARALLNDIQSLLTLNQATLASDKETEVALSQAKITEISEREKEVDIFNLIKKLFKNPTNSETIRIFDDTKMDMSEISLWIEENIPLEYSGRGLYRAYESLSKSDIFKGRIYRQQYWRFLVYQNFFLTAGISYASKLKSSRFTKYQKPSRILKIWLSNQKNAVKKSIIMKYAKVSHISKKKVRKDYHLLPLILSQIDERTARKMDLEEKEQKFIQDKKAAIIVANKLNRFRI